MFSTFPGSQVIEFISKAISQSGMLVFTSSVVITLSVSAVLCAVALNFIGLQGSYGKVKREKKSPVATLSMMAFFFAYYLLIHNRVIAYSLPPGVLQTVLVVIGTLLVVAGAVVNIIGRFNLGKNWANQVTVYDSQQLVSTGVFGLVRHPLYASLLWMFTGASITYLNASALAVTCCVFLPMMYYRARQEEVMLTKDLQGYAEYCQRVGMFWPQLSLGGRNNDEHSSS